MHGPQLTAGSWATVGAARTQDVVGAMAGTENTAPSDLSFTDQVAQMDRGLKVFLSGLVIGLTVLVVTVVRMCRAALGTEGGYGMEETTPPPPKHPPKPTAAPSKAHATAEIRPAGKVAPKAKNKSGPKAAGPHGRDLEEGAGGQAHSRGRGKPSRSAPPKASSSGRKAAPGKALGGEKSCRKAATFQPVAKASDDGVSDDMRVAESDEEEGSSSPLLTRVTFQVGSTLKHAECVRPLHPTASSHESPARTGSGRGDGRDRAGSCRRLEPSGAAGLSSGRVEGAGRGHDEQQPEDGV